MLCSEYGVYLTRKSECALLRREAAIHPIPFAGDPSVGALKLPYTHKILADQPWVHIRRDYERDELFVAISVPMWQMSGVEWWLH